MLLPQFFVSILCFSLVSSLGVSTEYKNIRLEDKAFRDAKIKANGLKLPEFNQEAIDLMRLLTEDADLAVVEQNILSVENKTKLFAMTRFYEVADEMVKDEAILYLASSSPLDKLLKASEPDMSLINLIFDFRRYIDFGERNWQGDMYLHTAARNPKCPVEVMGRLIDIDATQLDAINYYSQTPLHVLVDRSPGDQQRIQLLVESAARAVNVADFRRTTPLMTAAKHGAFDVVDLLLERGADSRATDAEGNHALHYASVTVDDARIVERLVEKGALVNLGNKEGETPLHWAAYWGRPGVVRKLLELGAKPRQKTESGVYAIQYATSLAEIDAEQCDEQVCGPKKPQKEDLLECIEALFEETFAKENPNCPLVQKAVNILASGTHKTVSKKN